MPVIAAVVKCKKCGFEVRSDWKFCPKCGDKIVCPKKHEACAKK
ncbi:zinc-ribbon domain-containing protein [Chloroflexota bacterium]